jgi:hypothetical protein
LDFGQTPDNAQAHHASAIIARLCMLMCGDTKMEELIFSVRSRNTNSSVATSMLPQIFWPIILLRSNIVVRFEGVSGIAGSQQPEHDERESQRELLPPGTAEAVCKLVAKLRRRREAARINACSMSAYRLTPISYWMWHVMYSGDSGYFGWSDEDDESDIHDDSSFNATQSRINGGSRINELAGDLEPLAVIVDTVDIASGSTRWKMLQGLVDDAETEMLNE